MPLSLEHNGPVSRVVMDLPTQNLLNIEVMDELVDLHRQADAREETRVIVTASAVEGVFSNGLDPKYVIGMPTPERPKIFNGVGRMLHGLFSLSKPHIAEISGPAMAGGAIIALTADFRYFDAEIGRMSFSEAKVGLPLPPAVIAAIECFVAKPFVREVAMLAANMDAAYAQKVGLCDGQWGREDYRAMVDKAIGRLARLSPTVVAETKRNMRKDVLPKLESLMNREDEILPFVGDDLLGEGLLALVENRFPNFKR